MLKLIEEYNMHHYKITIDWFPFWPLIGLMAFNGLVAGLCLLAIGLAAASMVP